MTELDFDELDKAVSSVMEKTANTSADGTAPTAATPESTSIPSSPPVTSPALLPIKPPSRPSSPPAARRAGRFMDVVHPSSDMATPNKPTMPSQRLTITPPTMTAAPVDPPKKVSGGANELQSPVMPDPIALADSTPIPDSIDSSDSPATTPPDAPLTSPFLPDAKVEKRPLGGNIPSLDAAIAAELGKVTIDEAVPTTESVDSIKVKTSEKLEPKLVEEPTARKDDKQLTPSVEEAVLPPELNQDLVAIESGTASEQTEVEPPTVPKATETTTPTESIGAGSIQPQYHEQPSSGDTSHAPIFDAAADHSPLDHPVKPKSGWLWVIVIIVLLLVGAGAGAAAYFSGLI